MGFIMSCLIMNNKVIADLAICLVKLATALNQFNVYPVQMNLFMIFLIRDVYKFSQIK